MFALISLTEKGKNPYFINQQRESETGISAGLWIRGILIRILLFSSLTFKTPTKNYFFVSLLTFFKGTFTSFSKIKSHKEVTKSSNQGFSYYFCLMVEGSGSVQLSLFGLLCTAVLINGWDPQLLPHPPAFELIYVGAIGRSRQTTSLWNPLDLPFPVEVHGSGGNAATPVSGLVAFLIQQDQGQAEPVRFRPCK
jgi:hypothetical protein